MESNTTGRSCQVFIVRSKTGYQVVPGTHITSSDSSVTFCNRAQTSVEVRLPAGVFAPSLLPLAHGQSGITNVAPGKAGVYEYDVQETGRANGFFATGNSSPRIIVDP